MNLNYRKTFMAALLAVGLMAPCALSAQKRVHADGTEAKAKTVQVNQEGRAQIAAFHKMIGRFRANVGLGGGGNAELPISPARVPSNHLTRSAFAPRANAYALVPSHRQGVGYGDALFGKIDFATGNFERVFRGSEYSFGEDYAYLTSCIVDGIIYIPAYDEDMIEGSVVSYWRRIDLETGQRLSNLNPKGDYSNFCYALTYNEKNGKFYGISVAPLSGLFGELYEYDFTGDTPVRTYLGNIDNIAQGAGEPGFTASICYNPSDGNLYCIKDSGKMYIITPKVNPTLTLVAEFSNDESAGDEYMAIPDENLPSPLTYSPRDHAFVTIYRNSFRQTMDLVLIDSETFEVVAGKSASIVGYFCSLNCDDPYAEDDAPARATLDAVNLDKASLSGSVAFTTSNETYGGDVIQNQKLVMELLIDGNVVGIKEPVVGGEDSMDFTTTQGQHTFSIRPVFEGEKRAEGPVTSKVVWVGHDNPKAPAGLSLNGNNLTWTAVDGVGAHKGYVDASAITYDVFFDGKKQNAAPLTDPSFTISQDVDLLRRSITVTATANGMTSAHSAGLSEVFGRALNLPLSLEPTESQGKLFTPYNANHDAYEFEFVPMAQGFPNTMGIFMADYTMTPDDWLFLPKMKFTSAEHLYEVAFKYSNYYITNEKQQSNIKVYIGKEANPEAMTQLIYERESDSVREPLSISAIFSVDEPGDYYIGFYTGFAVNNNSRGCRLWDFNINSLENVSTASPGPAEDVVVSPAPDGVFAANISCKFPTKTIAGDPLDPDTDVTLLAKWEEQEVKATGKPGQPCNLTLPVEIDGFAFVDLMTVVGESRVNKRTYRVFIGIDQPSKPLNVKSEMSADNLSMTLTWDPPTIGQNGGWIDSNALTYNIYTHSGISSTLIGTSRTNQYVFSPASGKTSQGAFYVGPSAVSRSGESMLNDFAYDYVGKLYDVPMLEEFTQTTQSAFQLSPWKYKVDEGFGSVAWNHLTSVDGLGVGNCVLKEGGFICSPLEGGNRGALLAPKASTTGCDNARIGIRFWDYSQTPNIEIWGRRFGNEKEERLFTINPERPDNASAQWVDWNEELPAEYQNCPWVQINVRCYLRGSESYFILDSYRVYRDVDHDFRVTDISAPALVQVGETIEVSATAGNSGLEPGTSNMVMKLTNGEGKLLELREVPIRRLAPGASFNKYVEWEIKPEYIDYGKLTFSAAIVDDTDEVASNNEMTTTIDVRKNDLPVVRNITGKWNDAHNTVTIDWEIPSATYGDWESFEFDKPFLVTDQISYWQNIDMDGLPQFAVENLRWPDDNKPSAWTVYNAEKMNTMDDARLAPHNGKQMLIARSCDYDMYTEEPKQSADWLISPEVVGGTTVEFWMNTLDTQYKETVEVWYSTTDTTLGNEIVQNGTNWTCGSFKRIQPFTKSGTESWELIKCKLPEDAKYFAIVYRSWGQFAAMIDEISFTPRQLQQWEIDSYNIWRSMTGEDGHKYDCIGWHHKGQSIVDETIGDNNASYYVTTNVLRNGELYSGPRGTELRMSSLGVDDVTALEGIIGGTGEIIVTGLAGKTLDVYTADGKYLRSLTVTEARQSVSIDGGIYIVKAGNALAKILVK